MSVYLTTDNSRQEKPITPMVPPSLEEAQRGKMVPSLVLLTKSCNKPENMRLERWAMQSAARDVLPSERVSKCLRTISIHKHPTSATLNNCLSIDYFRNVEIIRSKENFHYGNLTTCGSVWHCPICAGKISEQRRTELTAAVKNWKRQGGEVLLLTLTVPHYVNQRLQVVVTGLTNALRSLTNSRQWKTLAPEIGLHGRIRALEVTYGENGWHPHFHLLLFVYRSPDREALQAQILELWKTACLKSSLPEPNFHGVKVDDGTMAAEYVGKWGIEHEMTKGHIKKSREGYSPFDLLRVVLGSSPAGRFLNGKVEDASALFREYGKAFKGKRQLVWSQGLKNDLLEDMADLSDEEIADQVEPDAELFARVPLHIWKIVLKRKLRGVVLEKCRQGFDVFDAYLDTLISDTNLTIQDEITEIEPEKSQKWTTSFRGGK